MWLVSAFVWSRLVIKSIFFSLQLFSYIIFRSITVGHNTECFIQRSWLLNIRFWIRSQVLPWRAFFFCQICTSVFKYLIMKNIWLCKWRPLKWIYNPVDEQSWRLGFKNALYQLYELPAVVKYLKSKHIGMGRTCTELENIIKYSWNTTLLKEGAVKPKLRWIDELWRMWE